MQLPPDEEVVQVSGAPPIRARKVRYYLDRRLADRVAPPPAGRTRLPVANRNGDWAAVLSTDLGAGADRATAADEGGHRIEPELAGQEPKPTPTPEQRVDLDLEGEGDEAQQAAEVQRRFRAAARQAALDPDDGIPL
jgi:type IV secretion system protein VirD4